MPNGANISFNNGSSLDVVNTTLNFIGDFVQVKDNNSKSYFKASDIRTVTEWKSSFLAEFKTGRQARILIGGQHIQTSGTIASNSGAFISVKNEGTTTWIPEHMFDEIEILSHTKSDKETAKFSKMLSAALIKTPDVESTAVTRGDSFMVTTSNRKIDVASGWLKPEGSFVFIRDFVRDREFWIPSRLVTEIEFQG